jgi:hypothetical protein
MSNLITNVNTDTAEHVVKNDVNKQLGYTAWYDYLQSRDLLNSASMCTLAYVISSLQKKITIIQIHAIGMQVLWAPQRVPCLLLGFIFHFCFKSKLIWGQMTHKKCDYNQWAVKDIGVNSWSSAACYRRKPRRTCNIGTRGTIPVITSKIRWCVLPTAPSQSHMSNCWLPHGTEPSDAWLSHSNWLLSVVVPSGHAIAVSQGLGHYRSYKIMVRRKIIISIVRKGWSIEHNRQEGKRAMAGRERKLLLGCKNRTWPPV